MSFEVGPLIKASVANGASMRGFLHVQNPVNGQSPRLTKTFPAFATLERLLFGMNVSVVTKMVLASEGLSTNITVEGALIGVSPFMNQQVV